MDTVINFGGFYNSHHDDIVERAVSYIEGAVDDYGDIDYSKLDDVQWHHHQLAYCREYIDILNDELGTTILFQGIDSPKFYNFSTDTILAEVSQKDVLSLFKYIRENSLGVELRNKIQTSTTYVDGFIPFYTFQDFLKKDNRTLLFEVLITVIINHLSVDHTFVVEDFYC